MKTARNILVQNDKGGVGKSLVSAGIVCAAAADKLHLRGIEAESEPRLSTRYPGIFEHVPVGNDAGALLDSDPERAVEQFDPIFQAMIEGGALIDSGANVADKMMTIMSRSGVDSIIGDGGSNTALVIVTTAELESIQAALANASAAEKLMPQAKKFLWINAYRGDIAEESELVTSMRNSGFEILRMPACKSPAWTIVRDHSLVELVKLTTQDLMKIGGLNFMQANRQIGTITGFVGQILKTAEPVIEWAKKAA